MATFPLPDPIQFAKGGPFYDMVGAFVVALVGIESVGRPDNPMGFHPKKWVALEGKVHPHIRFDQYEVHQELILRNFSDFHILNSWAGMLMNTAYAAARIWRKEEGLSGLT